MKQETCEERIERHLESRLDDLRTMFAPTKDMVTLGDDGTLDTVICLGDVELRFADTSDYRDEDTGELDLDSFLDDHFDEIAEKSFEQFYEYGLSFDYVAPGTFNDQDEGYFRYQISWGGPSEEFRFYTNPDFTPHRIEFWFLDWGDGASLTLYNDDRTLLDDIFQFFDDCGSVQHEFDKAMEV